MKPITTLLAATVAFGIAVGPASAQMPKWPDRDLTMISGGAAGSLPDLLTRIIEEPFQAKYGRKILIENRPGAGGMIAHEAIIRAKPDGYHFGAVSLAMAVVGPLTNKNLRFDAIKDLKYLARMTTQANIIYVRPDSTIKTMKDIIEQAKASPGRLRYGASGLGTTTHMTGVAIEQRADIKMRMIPYNGGGPAVLAVLAGDVEIVIQNMGPSPAGAVKSGQVRAIAVTSSQRLNEFPDVPTIAESALPGFEVTTWYGFAAPLQTPPEIVNQFAADIGEFMKMPSVLAKVAAAGVEPAFLATDDFDKFIATDLAKWKPIVEASGVVVQ